MQTAALTFAALGTCVLFLGGVAAVGGSRGPLQVLALALGCGFLLLWGRNLAHGGSLRAAGLLLLTLLGAELGLAYFALFIEPHVRIFATTAAPLLLLAIGCSYCASRQR
jgi:hypothetical protein